MVCFIGETLLNTKWISLMNFMFNKDWVDFKRQNIYKSNKFFKIMDELERLTWVKSRTYSNGCIDRKEFSLTLEGKIVTKMAFAWIK